MRETLAHLLLPGLASHKEGKNAKVLVNPYQTIRREVVADPSTTKREATVNIHKHLFLF